MRKVRIKVLAILLLFCMLLSGCNEWKNYIHTDASLTRAAEKALEKKYDEEFIIHKVWVACQTTFYAVCSPKSDEEVVFEAEIWKDGRGVYQDEYAEGVVAQCIAKKISPEVEEVYGKCFVSPRVFHSEKEFASVEKLTLEDYMNEVKDADGLIRVFVMKGTVSDREMEKEYKYISEKLSVGIMQNMTCSIYFVDDVTMSLCREYFHNNSYIRSRFDEIIGDCKYFGFGYHDGKINKTYEDYKKLRVEVGKYE